MRSVYVTTTVEVELSEIDDEDLLEEVVSRNLEGAPTPEFMDRCRDLLKLGRDEDALSLLRAEVQERFGCILP